jgi:uncharacterized MnhB-related membrane protein
MSAALTSLGAQALALALTLGVIAAALGALTARSLYVMGVYLAAAGALAAVAMLALGAPDASLAQALFGFVLAPVILLAALLLSAQGAKPRRRGLPWLTIAAALAAGGVVLWAAPELAAATRGVEAPFVGALAPWLAPLVFVAAAACVGLLGYGERGALQRAPGRDE